MSSFGLSEGRALAQVRAQELALAAHVHHARGYTVDLRVGNTFTLESHPTFEDYNIEYVVIAARRSPWNCAECRIGARG